MKIRMILVLMLLALLSACILPPPFGKFPGHGRGGGNGGHSSESRGGRY